MERTERLRALVSFDRGNSNPAFDVINFWSNWSSYKYNFPMYIGRRRIFILSFDLGRCRPRGQKGFWLHWRFPFRRCTGCDWPKFMPLPMGALACCPDSRYYPVRQR
jgi:hypothetical protein